MILMNEYMPDLKEKLYLNPAHVMLAKVLPAESVLSVGGIDSVLNSKVELLLPNGMAIQFEAANEVVEEILKRVG